MLVSPKMLYSNAIVPISLAHPESFVLKLELVFFSFDWLVVKPRNGHLISDGAKESFITLFDLSINLLSCVLYM